MSNNGFESSLPTYDQIAGWLGAEWVMMCTGFDDPAPREWPAMGHPSPWTHRVFVGDYQCLLLHAPTGQRVKITAPKESGIPWNGWFRGIRNRAIGHVDSIYHKHVRWLDPDTKTSGSGQPPWQAARNVHDNLMTPCAGCDLCRLAAAPRNPQPTEPRWQTTDPARIAALEAKLAEQVASGGQDCAPARSLVERADRLRREAEARRHPVYGRVISGVRSDGLFQALQPGPRLMRHELPLEQRASYKSQSTDRRGR